LNFNDLIADRMQLIESSGIRKVFDLAAKLTDPINLSIGQPDFDVPEPVKAKAIQAIQDGMNKYTLTQGIPELRSAVVESEKQSSGIVHDGVVITSGVSGAILLSFMALLNPGDEVLIPDPYFVMYKHICKLVGGVPVFVDTYPAHRLSVEQLEKAVTDKTKLLLINSPNNPSGVVLSDQELQTIAEWAKQKHILIISDEIYRTFSYDGPCVSIARYTDEVLLLNGLSKMVGMTGWRLGYAVGPEEVIAEMIKLQQFTFVCAPSFAQYAALEALKIDKEPIVASYRRKRDIIYEGLKDKFRLARPEGAFYAFVEAPGGDAEAFVARAIENNVLIIPGGVFSEKNTHFRIAYPASDETLQKGVEVLNRLV